MDFLKLLVMVITFIGAQTAYLNAKESTRSFSFELPVADVFEHIENLEDLDSAARQADQYAKYLERSEKPQKNIIDAYLFSADRYLDYAIESGIEEAYNRSAELYQQAKVRAQNIPENAPIISQSEYGMAYVAFSLGDIETAKVKLDAFREASGNKYDYDERFLTGQILFSEERFEEAASLYKQHIEELLGLESVLPFQLGSTISSYGDTLYRLGYYEEAEQQFLAALEAYADTDAYELIADTFSSLNTLYAANLEYIKREENLLNAVAYFETQLPAAVYVWLDAKTNLAYHYKEMFQYEDALELAYQIIDYYDAFLGGPQTQGCMAFNLIGLMEQELGNYAEAELVFRKMIEESDRRERGQCFHAGYGNLASLKFELEEYDQAIKYFEKGIRVSADRDLYHFDLKYLFADSLSLMEGKERDALKLYNDLLQETINESRTGDGDILLHQRLSQIYHELDEHEQALQHANHMARLFDQQFFSEYEKFTDESYNLYRWLPEYLAYFYLYSSQATQDLETSEKYDELSFKYAQMSKVTEPQISAWKSYLKVSSGNEAVQEINTLEVELSKVNADIKSYIFDQAYDQQKMGGLLKKRAELTSEIEAYEQQLPVQSTGIQFLSIDDVIENLSDNEAYIFVMPSYYYDEHLIYIVDIEGYWLDIVDVSVDNVTQLVESIRSSLTVDINGKLPPFDYKSSHKLYELLFDYYFAQLKQDSPFVNSVKFSFYGPLQSVPPSLFVQNTEASEFLIDSYEFSLLPAVNALTFMTAPEIRPTSNFWGAGKPNFTGTQYANLRGISFVETNETNINQEIKKLPALPDTEIEINKLSKLFSGERNVTKLGKELDESVFFREELSEFDVIAIATHGLQSNEFSGISEAALLVPFFNKIAESHYDGILTASEIKKLDLNAQLVILSACNTAYGSADYSEVLGGLTSSFLAAGARSMFVSNWSIDSQTTADFTVELVSRVISDPTIALSKALQETIKFTRKKGLEHPFYWASFVYAGQ